MFVESKGLRKSKRLAEKRQMSKSSINTAAPKVKGRQSKKRQTTAPNITETLCQRSGQDTPVAVPPPPPPPPPPVTPAQQRSLPLERSKTERKAASSGPLKELNHSNIQVTLPVCHYLNIQVILPLSEYLGDIATILIHVCMRIIMLHGIFTLWSHQFCKRNLFIIDY